MRPLNKKEMFVTKLYCNNVDWDYNTNQPKSNLWNSIFAVAYNIIFKALLSKKERTAYWNKMHDDIMNNRRSR